MKTYVNVPVGPMPSIIVCAILMFALFACSGCATTPGDRSTIARVAVTYATYKVIENNPDHGPRIVVISQAVRQVAGGEAFNTVALLDTFIRSQIKWERLSAADTMLAHMLLDEIKRQLIAKVGDGVLTSDKLLVVGEVAGWIEDAAKAATHRVTFAPQIGDKWTALDGVNTVTYIGGGVVSQTLVHVSTVP